MPSLGYKMHHLQEKQPLCTINKKDNQQAHITQKYSQLWKGYWGIQNWESGSLLIVVIPC